MNVIMYRLLPPLLLLSKLLYAQEDLMLRAMQDELSSNMKQLELPGHERPFFIFYSASVGQNHIVSATLGSLTESTVRNSRNRNSVRVLVGSYEFNDESLDDDLFSSPTVYDIELPVENDYQGIRRSFWSSTDNVYKNAARHFAKHKETLKNKGIPLAKLPHRSFARGNPTKLVLKDSLYHFDRKRWEGYIKSISSVFREYPSITESAVNLQFVQGTNFYVNSEGLQARLPYQYVALGIFGSSSENIFQDFNQAQINIVAHTPADLPDTGTIKAGVNRYLRWLSKCDRLPTLSEEYEGPVLMIGEYVVDFFETSFGFEIAQALQSSDFLRSTNRFIFDREQGGGDAKVGRRILGENVSLIAKPHLKEYNGRRLLGSFEMDNEGIIPPDEFVLVQKGILKNKMNNRTLLDSAETANGFGNGPGVLEVNISAKSKMEELYRKLIDLAKSAGLEYAILIKSDSSGYFSRFYQINVKDGSQQEIQPVYFPGEGARALRNIEAASDVMQVHDRFSQMPSQNFSITSYITPSAILMNELFLRSLSQNDEPEQEDIPKVAGPLERKPDPKN